MTCSLSGPKLSQAPKSPFANCVHKQAKDKAPIRLTLMSSHLSVPHLSQGGVQKYVQPEIVDILSIETTHLADDKMFFCIILNILLTGALTYT